jgi:hypothetical protein
LLLVRFWQRVAFPTRADAIAEPAGFDTRSATRAGVWVIRLVAHIERRKEVRFIEAELLVTVLQLALIIKLLERL